MYVSETSVNFLMYLNDYARTFRWLIDHVWLARALFDCLNLDLLTLHNLRNNVIQGLRLGQAKSIICQLLILLVVLYGVFSKDESLQEERDSAKVILGQFFEAFFLYGLGAYVLCFPLLTRGGLL